MTHYILNIAAVSALMFSNTVWAQWDAYTDGKTLYIENNESGEEMIDIASELQQNGLFIVVTHVNLLTNTRETQTIWSGFVDRIVFDGDTDADYVTNNTELPSFMFGDDGDDVLVGGGNIDNLYGGHGCDSLLGMGGDDYLDAGMDDFEDVVRGGAGDDTLIYYSLRYPNLAKHMNGGYRQKFNRFDAGNDANDVEQLKRQTYYQYLDWNGITN